MSGLWSRVDALIDGTGSLPALRAHRIHLLAARRWRRRGLPVRAELEREETLAAARALAVPVVLGQVRAACQEAIVLLKGPEVAALYSDPVARPFADLDLLVPAADAAQAALLAAGFEAPDDAQPYVGKYHRPPLTLAGFPLHVEIHERPKWIPGLAFPAVDLFSLAVPSATGVTGIAALPRAHHALLLAAHSWAHEPLRRVLDLVDVAAAVDGLDGAEMRALAREYGLERVWRATAGAVDAVLAGDRTTWPLRLWARNLPELRERTVLESHAARVLGDFWALPPRRAARRLPSTLARELRPAPHESWREKLVRARLAVRNASVAASQHQEEVERAHARSVRNAGAGQT